MAIFRSASALVGWLLQEAADRIDAAYQPGPGQQYKGRVSTWVEGMFGSFILQRDYYYHEGKHQGHYPGDAALGLECGHTPALTRVICLEGADETSYQKAEHHLEETGGIRVSARQIQRMVQRVGAAAQQWQQREAHPDGNAVPIMYVSADGTGVPMALLDWVENYQVTHRRGVYCRPVYQLLEGSSGYCWPRRTRSGRAGMQDRRQ